MLKRVPISTTKIGKRQWKVNKTFCCYFGSYVEVPEGFISDGASVPRIFWWFLDPATELFEAAVVHDYLLKNKDPRAHKYLYKVALHYNVPKYKAKIAFWAVSLYHKVKDLFKGF